MVQRVEKPEALYDVHRLALQYPLIGDDEYTAMVQSMQDHGFNRLHPIILYEGKILDGRSRYRAAREAGVAAIFVDLIDEDPEQYVRDANEHRRHLSQEWLQKKRGERVERVAEKRQQGKSLRTIAEEEGISKAQVERDLSQVSPPGTPDANDQVCPPGTPEPEIPIPDPPKVQGKDGKSYPTKKKEPDKPKPGKPVFDDRALGDLMGKLARMIHERGKAFGKTEGFTATADAHEQTLQAWKKWQKERS